MLVLSVVLSNLNMLDKLSTKVSWDIFFAHMLLIYEHFLDAVVVFNQNPEFVTKTHLPFFVLHLKEEFVAELPQQLVSL